MSCCIFAHPDQESESIQYISDYLNMKVVNQIPTSGSFIDLRKNGLHFTKDSSNLSSFLHVDFLSGWANMQQLILEELIPLQERLYR